MPEISDLDREVFYRHRRGMSFDQMASQMRLPRDRLIAIYERIRPVLEPEWKERASQSRVQRAEDARVDELSWAHRERQRWVDVHKRFGKGDL